MIRRYRPRDAPGKKLIDARGEARRRLEAVYQLVNEPEGLIHARQELGVLASRKNAFAAMEAQMAIRLKKLANIRPCGIWARIVGKTRVHDRLIDKVSEERARICKARHDADGVHRRAEDLLRIREADWCCELRAINADRAVKRTAIGEELSWFKDAKACLLKQTSL